MLTAVQDYTLNLWRTGRRVKTSASGWLSANAVCCTHNGESPDTRGRGGLHSDSDGKISYSCFNCSFKASYQPGRHLSVKFKRLLRWMGADDNEIQRLAIEAIRVRDLIAPDRVIAEDSKPVYFKPRPLPEGSISFSELRTFLSLTDDQYTMPDNWNTLSKVDYVYNRFIDQNRYEFYITDLVDHSLHQRVIVPCYWQGEIIGYTARAVVDGVKPKYYSSYEPNYVFNMDQQRRDSKFVIVCEGPFDAMSVDGIAVLGNECSEIQADIIDSLGREVIVVPDKDRAGTKLIDAAIEYGWSVSFPLWYETCKDINDAVIKYGRLFAIKSILEAKESNRLKIELLRKKLYN